MANEQNLIPNEQRTPSERRENARKAGIQSGKVRREIRDRKRRMQKALDLLVNDPKTIDKLKDAGVSVDGITYEDAIDAMQVLKAAREGDTPAYKAVKEEAYGKLDNKTSLEVSGEIEGITINVVDYSKGGK